MQEKKYQKKKNRKDRSGRNLEGLMVGFSEEERRVGKLFGEEEGWGRGIFGRE